jgi:hypothetical protein
MVETVNKPIDGKLQSETLKIKKTFMDNNSKDLYT